MSIGAIDSGRIEAMMAQLKAAADRTSPANANPLSANPVSDSALQTKQTAGAGDFQSVLKTSLDQVNQAQLQSRQLAQRFEMGDSTVSLADAMISLEKSSIAMKQTIQVRNKLVEAYQNIMSMGI